MGQKVGTHSPKLMPQIGARKAVRVRHITEARDGGFGVRAVGSHWVVGEFKNEMMEFSTPSSTNGRLISGHMDSR